MYYDDATRRFNFVSGLLFGAVLGAGLALLARPRPRAAVPTLARSARRLQRRARRGASRLRDGVEDSWEGVIDAGRRQLRR